MFSNAAGDNTLNGIPYNGSVSHVAEQRSMQEWYLYGGEGHGLSNQHTYHQHMTHFQIMSESVDTNGLVTAVGDYRDTVPLYRDLNLTIRFIPPFTGRMMIHCHMLRHEDMGMMTVVNFTAPRLNLRPASSHDALSRTIAAVVVAVLAAATAVFGGLRFFGRLGRPYRCKCLNDYHEFTDAAWHGAGG
jgi:hypothetical protein